MIQLTQNEFPELKKLLTECDLPTQDITGNNQVFYGTKREDELVAVCGIELFGNQAILRSLAVKENHRGSGLGLKIYQYTIEEALDKFGVQTLYLLTTTADKFFEKLHWRFIHRKSVPQEISQSQEFKSMCPDTAICMMLPIANTTSEKALNTFSRGYNCSQSVLESHTEILGVPKEVLLPVSACFGAGMGYKGETCGAVTGAYMTLGLKYSAVNASPKEKELLIEKVKLFDERFKLKHQSLKCKELLHADISSQPVLEKLREKEVFKKTCPLFVNSAVLILNEILKDE